MNDPMNKLLPSHLFVSAIGIFCLVAWTNPVPEMAISSNLDDQEEVIRERIPTAVSIVNPVYNPAGAYYNTIFSLKKGLEELISNPFG